MTVSLNDIRSVDWSIALDQAGEVVEGMDDIDQCLRTIIGTPLGADPLRPLFGCDAWLHIDKPIDHARPLIVRDVIEALSRWEPRATILQVLVEYQPPVGLAVRIRWRETGGDVGKTTEVQYG